MVEKNNNEEYSRSAVDSRAVIDALEQKISVFEARIAELQLGLTLLKQQHYELIDFLKKALSRRD